jgi:alpha-methylacyl-CoA racemase
MVDGVALISQMLWEMRGNGAWTGGRGENLLDSGAPFYDTYMCADGRFVAVGALEPQFYRALIDKLGLQEDDLPPQSDPDGWPELRARFASVFLSHTRDSWVEVFRGTDACVTPVLSAQEAASDDHLVARRTLGELCGMTQAFPAPRMSRTPATIPVERPEADIDQILGEWTD